MGRNVEAEMLPTNKPETVEALLKHYRALRTGGFQHDKAVCLVRTIHGAINRDHVGVDAPIQLEPTKQVLV